MNSKEDNLIKPANSSPHKHEVKSSKSGSSDSLRFHKHLKKDAYRDALKNIRSNFPGWLKLVSSFMHSPVIEAIFNFFSRWLARPGPLLGAAIISLAGTATSAYFAHHLGFALNNLLPILLFGIGYVLVTIADILVKATFKRPE
ncbi:MAG TPA: hypothetical protein VMR34_06210 [Candidatus Saccharimonadales bacterium]|nr:hypothetical protein [Candidatus Saccharimonadales bacterium]